MEALNGEAQKLLKASMAQGTWDSYSRAVEKFIAFRATVDLQNIWPSPNSHIIAYISFLARENWAHSTIALHMSALAFVHKINNWPDPTVSFFVKKIKEGLKRLNGRQDRRRPITFQILSRLVSVLPAVCSSSYEVILFKAAFLLAFFGFMRVGEYACVSKKTLSRHVLFREDVSLSDEALNICFKHSKTDQRGHSVAVTIQNLENNVLCPVRAMKDFLEIRAPVSGPLFLHFNQDPLTMGQVSAILKKSVGVVGLPVDDFSPHSFRIGAATSAAIRGVPEDSIKLMGRWNSSAFESYIRPQRLISFL